tara:strand:+ start:19280 stop:19909 length:630 start_codon:yes stop_codon:yes gene_type:complete
MLSKFICFFQNSKVSLISLISLCFILCHSNGFSQDCPSFDPENSSGLYFLGFDYGSTSKTYADFPATIVINGITYSKNTTNYGTIFSYISPSPDPTGSVDINDFSIDFGFGGTCHYIGKVLPVPDVELKLKNIKLSPNPIKSTELLLISNPDNVTTSVIIYDLTGKTISNIPNSKTQDLEIDISTFKQGLYLVKLESTKGTVVKKIIVK